MKSKRQIREEVWKKIEKFADFPFPVRGRIPNFKGSRKACEKVRELEEYKKAKAVFVAPDSPLLRLREVVLEDGKFLVAPKPHFRGIVVLKGNPKNATITRMLKYGTEVSPETLRDLVGKIDVFVQGCVAVDLNGNRIGKGTGYGDKEYHFLKRHGLFDDPLYVVVCHEVQIYEDLSYLAEEHDVRCDVILTPERILWTREGLRRGKAPRL